MRDRYLFRAKRIDNGEWVEGYYAVIGEKVVIIEKRGEEFYDVEREKKTHRNKVVEVDPSTICQCTGLKDKNDKLIFENDICRRALLPTKRIKTNFKIAYVPYKCCLSAIDLDGGNITFLSDYINNKYEVEIIGNIFDNKELLESEDKYENNY